MIPPRLTGSKATKPARARAAMATKEKRAAKVLMPDGRRVYPWMTREGFGIEANGRIVK